MSRNLSVLFSSFLLFLGSVLPAGAAASLVADLNPGEGSFSDLGVRSPLATIGSKILFVGEEPSSGRELWVSDGTPHGTEIVRDFCPGECSTDFGSLGTLRNRIAVFSVSGSSRYGLWRSDGTRQGTFLLGPNPGEPLQPCSDQNVVSWGNDLYLNAAGSGSCVLWKTDGTREGTRQVAGHAESLTRAGEKLFFVDDGLWVSDGTPNNATLLRGWTGQEPRILGSLGSRLLFVAPEAGDELWASDGTPSGTARLTEIAAPQPFNVTNSIKVLNGVAYFLVDDVTGGVDIWQSDGTAAGTRRTTAFGYANPFSETNLSIEIVRLGDRLIFVADDGLTGRRLWSSRGTPETTVPVECSGTCPVPERYSGFHVLGNRVLFAANDGFQGTELWSTDGTAAGTRIVRNLCLGSCSASPEDFQILAGRLFFLAYDGTSQGIWKTDGTSQGTVLLAPRVNSSQLFVAQAGPTLFFSAENREGGGLQLWTSDGTPEGSEPITAIQGGKGSEPSSFTALGDRVLFVSCITYQGELWRSDGTAAGTARIDKELGGSCSDIRNLTPAGGLVFFNNYRRVWRTDGTPEGTFELLSNSSFWEIGKVVPFQGGVAFTVYDDDAHSLWTSDGTVAGTRKRFEWSGRSLSMLAGSGSTLYLLSESENGETQLFRSDGTLAGTHLVETLPSFYYSVSSLTWVGNTLYFVEEGEALWKTDGTAAGTGELSLPGETRRGIHSLAEHEGDLYFLSSERFSSEDDPLELWRLDAVFGAIQVRAIGPAAESFRASMVSAGGRLFFAGNDGEHGVELWESDGTAAGTRMVEDIAPGPASSHPGGLAAIGNQLFFSADNGIHGREPWVLPLTGAACQPSDTVLCLGGGRFKVETSWRDFEGRTGRGHAVSLTADTGYFWFFDPGNVEVISKVLDGQGVNGHHWAFYGALSTVEYTLTVTDTQTGAARRYVNPPGRLGSVGDTNAFGPLGATGSGLSVGPEAAVFEPIVAVEKAAGDKAPCVASATRLCLGGGRFAVTARWKDFDGNVGDGKAVPLAGGDTGYFWFFGADNVEVVLKVLDGRPVNGKFWVFYGALSSVEYTLTVTDTETGAVKTYRNPSGRLGSVADTGAF
jgi:ELWxxDGT repeat protein